MAGTKALLPAGALAVLVPMGILSLLIGDLLASCLWEVGVLRLQDWCWHAIGIGFLRFSCWSVVI